MPSSFPSLKATPNTVHAALLPHGGPRHAVYRLHGPYARLVSLAITMSVSHRLYGTPRKPLRGEFRPCNKDTDVGNRPDAIPSDPTWPITQDETDAALVPFLPSLFIPSSRIDEIRAHVLRRLFLLTLLLKPSFLFLLLTFLLLTAPPPLLVLSSATNYLFQCH